MVKELNWRVGVATVVSHWPHVARVRDVCNLPAKEPMPALIVLPLRIWVTFSQ